MTTKDTIIALYRAFASRDQSSIRALLHDDAIWVAPGGNATQVGLGLGAPDQAGPPTGVNNLDADEIARFMAHDFPRFFGNASNEIKLLIADGEVGVIEHRLSATLPTGTPYTNDYCFIVEVLDGLVTTMREYMDTRGGWQQVFGSGPGEKLI